MTTSQLYLQLRRPPFHYLLVALIAIVVLISLTSNFGGVSTKLGRLIPHDAHVGAGDAQASILDDVFNATLGFEKIFAVSLPERTDHRDGLLLASALSDIQIEFIDGVHGGTISSKALPGDHIDTLSPNGLGAWRAHLNALDEVIKRNLSTALIFEDDVDWDIRLKSSLREFALSTNAILQGDVGELSFDNLPSLSLPEKSPYGDAWELLWIGHCGYHLPPGRKGMVVHTNDVTVPQRRYLRSFTVLEYTPLGNYPDHTRVTMRGQNEATCSLAYAVTQASARKILYELGLQRLHASYDLMLRGWCEDAGTCIGVLPQLFDHYRRAGPGDVDSDISEPSSSYRENPYTNNIRWSVRMNMKKLLNGETDYDDQYPDTRK